jgi:hypothetical protein
VVLPSATTSAQASTQYDRAVPPVVNYDDPKIYDPNYRPAKIGEPPYTPNKQYRPALIWWENQAVQETLERFDLPADDADSVRAWGRDIVRAQLWADLAAILAEGSPNTLPGAVLTNKQELYVWFTRIVAKQYVEIADYAIDEYERYAGQELADGLLNRGPFAKNTRGTEATGYCNYQMPGPYKALYDGYKSADCLGDITLLPGPNFLAPEVKFEDLVAVGTYKRAVENNPVTDDPTSPQRVMSLATSTAIASGATAAATGVAAGIAGKVVKGGLTSSKIVGKIWPNVAKATWRPAVDALGKVITKEVAKDAAKALTLLVSRTVARAIAASVGVIIDFIITTVLTSIDLANQLDLPFKLDALRKGYVAVTTRTNIDNNEKPNLHDIIATEDGWPGLQSTFNALVDEKPGPSFTCTPPGGIVIGPDWEHPCMYQPDAPAPSSSDPIWSITPRVMKDGVEVDGATYTSATLPVTSGLAGDMSTRTSGKGWFVSTKIDPVTGTPTTAVVPSLQLWYTDWDGKAWEAERLFDANAVAKHKFVITPNDALALPTDCTPSTCVVSQLKLMDSAGRKLKVSLVDRPVEPPNWPKPIVPSIDYNYDQFRNVEATYTISQPQTGYTTPAGNVVGVDYIWTFPCVNGSRPWDCGIDPLTGQVPTEKTFTGTSVTWGWSTQGTRSFKVKEQVTYNGTIVEAIPDMTYQVNVANSVNEIWFPQPAEANYDYWEATASHKAYVDLEALATSRLPVTLTVAQASEGVCEAVGHRVWLWGAGTCTITASQQGDTPPNIVNPDSVWGPATPITRSFTVNKGNFVMGVTRGAVQYSDPLPTTNLALNPFAALYGLTGSVTGCKAPDWVLSPTGRVIRPAGVYRLDGCTGLSSPDWTVAYNAYARVSPETATLTNTSPISTTPYSARLRAKLTQDADGNPGDLSKVTVDFRLFPLESDSPDPVFAQTGVVLSSDGTAQVDVTSLAAGTYVLVAQLTPSGAPYFAAPSVTTQVTVPAPAKPAVTTSPTSRTALLGSSTTFSVAGTGAPAPAVQWQQSTDRGLTWSPIGGATSTRLTLAVTSMAMSGRRYRAVLSNVHGTATSGAAALTVSITAPAKVRSLAATTTRTKAVVTWQAPAVMPVTSYQVRIKKLSSARYGSWRTVTTRSVTFSALRKGTTYKVQVRGRNRIGAGPAATVTFSTKR